MTTVAEVEDYHNRIVAWYYRSQRRPPRPRGATNMGWRGTRLVAWGAGALTALTVSSGCDTLGIGGGDCTLIGCTDGITVHLPAVPAGAYKVEIVIPGTGTGGPSYAYECAGGPGCLQDIFFPELVLESIIVQVTTSLGSRITEIPNPVYTTSRPNGPDCPPLCRQIQVSAQLPV